MQNKVLKRMMKTTTKFVNKNRYILCIIICLILVILLVDKLTGGIKEKFYQTPSAEAILACINRIAGTNPTKSLIDIIDICNILPE